MNQQSRAILIRAACPTKLTFNSLKDHNTALPMRIVNTVSVKMVISKIDESAYLLGENCLIEPIANSSYTSGFNIYIGITATAIEERLIRDAVAKEVVRIAQDMKD